MASPQDIEAKFWKALEDDRTLIDRLNPFVAAWYDGKSDPKLELLRLNPEHGEVWLNESSVFAGIKILLGVDPKRLCRQGSPSSISGETVKGAGPAF